MPLPNLPMLEDMDLDNPKVNQITIDNIWRLYNYLQKLLDNFSNATGEVVTSVSGDGAFDIDGAPTNIIYTPDVVTNEVNGTVSGIVEVSFTFPANTQSVMIFFRLQGDTIFNQLAISQSPYVVQGLRTGVTYEFKLAGIQVNNRLGPESPLTDVTIPTGTATIAPSDALYWVGLDNNSLTQDIVPSGELNVIDVDAPNGTIGIVANGVTNAKLAGMPTQTIKGNNAGGTATPIDLTATQARTLILGAVNTGWSVSNLVSTKTLDASAVPLDQQVLGTLISVLITKGILSA